MRGYAAVVGCVVIGAASMFMRTVLRARGIEGPETAATPEERLSLESAGIPDDDPGIVRYLLWRRALLTAAALLGLVAFCLLLLFTQSAMARSREIQKGAGLFLLVFLPPVLAQTFLIGTIWVCLLRWFEPAWTRAFLRFSWSLALLLPLTLALLPLVDMFFRSTPEGLAQGTELLDPSTWNHGATGPAAHLAHGGLRLLLGIGLFMGLLPGLFAVFPGAQRAAVELETLLPRPLLMRTVRRTMLVSQLLFVMTLCAFLQLTAGSLAMLAGIMLILIGLGMRLRLLHDRESTASPSGRISHHWRLAAPMLEVTGIACMIAAAPGAQIFGRPLYAGNGTGVLGPVDVLWALAWFGVMSCTAAVVAGDGLVRAWGHSATARVGGTGGEATAEEQRALRLAALLDRSGDDDGPPELGDDAEIEDASPAEDA